MSVVFTSNLPQVLNASEDAKRNALNAAGETISGRAKELTPVEFGRLRSSLTYEIEGSSSVAIGTNVEYAIYVHENLNAAHPVGQAKFLETAAREEQENVRDLVELALAGELPTI